MHQKWVKLSLVIVALAYHPITFALPTDKQEIMHVNADSADLNQQSHKGIYTGHVEFNQGSTHLHADKAMTQGNEKNQLILAIAEGNSNEQAHYWTKTAEDKPELHAYANTIRYNAETDIIELLGNAKIIQGQNSFVAPTIRYDRIKQQVISKNEGKQRTTIIFYPEKKTS